MSKYTKEEQLNILQQALQLEVMIYADTQELKKLSKEKFIEAAPSEPKRRKAEVYSISPDYSQLPTVPMLNKPEFNTWLINMEKTKQIKGINKLYNLVPCGVFGLILGLCLIFFMAYVIGSSIFVASTIFIYLCFAQKSNLQNNYNSVIANIDNINQQRIQYLYRRPDYIQAKMYAESIAQQQNQALIEQCQQQQKQYDDEYEQAMTQYNEVLLPAYYTRKDDWIKNHEMMVQAVSDDLNDCKNSLAQLHENTKLIPLSVRAPEKMYWLYQDMSTSEHDIERAIDLLNMGIQQELLRGIQEDVRYMNQDMLEGMHAIYSEVQTGNFLLDDVKSELVKTRNHIDIGMIINASQSHNTNKQLKNLNNYVSKMNRQF